MVKNVIANLDSSKVSGPDWIPVVVLKNCQPQLSYILVEFFNNCLKESEVLGRFHWCSLYLKVLGKGLVIKTTTLLVFFLWLVKFLKNFKIIVYLLDKLGLFLIFSMVLGLLNQLQILWQLYLIELTGLYFNRSGTTQTIALDISKAFDRVWHACLFRKLKFYGISGQICDHISSFLRTDGFKWFWMRILHKYIQWMLEFRKAPFLVLHFSYYTLMTFLILLSGILLSMQMILLSVVSVISHLICGNS